MRAEPHREAGELSNRTSPNHPAGLSRAFDESQGGNSSSEPAQPSHYLYVPNNAGIYSPLKTLKTDTVMQKYVYGFV